MKGSSQGLH